jgi:Transposase DDE domain
MHAPHIVHHFLTHACAWMHTARRKALTVSVLAALTGRRLTVTALGRSIVSRAQQKHCIKRADRLLSTRHLQAERVRVYTALGHWCIGSTLRPVLLVDWSDLATSKTHFLLRASLPLRGRALTVYEEVHSATTKEKPQTHKAFLERLQSVLPEGCRPLVITDAGFRTPWFRQVEQLGWDWIGRVRQRHKIQFGANGPWVACTALYPQATRTPKALGRVWLTASNPRACQLVLYKAKPKGRRKTNQLGHRARASHSEKHAARQREPWLLATSLPVRAHRATKVVRFYALRMQIEEAFRDLKSSQFGLSLEYSGTRHLERLQVLLLLAALALVVLWLLGKATELTEQHRH